MNTIASIPIRTTINERSVSGDILAFMFVVLSFTDELILVNRIRSNCRNYNIPIECAITHTHTGSERNSIRSSLSGSLYRGTDLHGLHTHPSKVPIITLYWILGILYYLTRAQVNRLDVTIIRKTNIILAILLIYLIGGFCDRISRYRTGR